MSALSCAGVALLLASAEPLKARTGRCGEESDCGGAGTAHTKAHLDPFLDWGHCTVAPCAIQRAQSRSSRSSSAGVAGILGAVAGVNLELDAGRELDFDLGLVIDAHDALGRTAGEHVPATGAIGGEEVEMAAGKVEPTFVRGEAEADDDAFDVVFVEHTLVGEHVCERRVGLALGSNGAQADVLEAPFDPHRGAAGRLRRDLGEQRVDVLGDADVDLDAGLEGGDERERAAALGLGGVHGAVLRGPVENPVGEHELAVERVERAEPQVAAAG